jgi:hypothetical protein
MHPDYEKLQNKSYANQTGGITIPADELGNIVEIPLGFQPLGISSSGNRIAIAAYFEPAICLAEIRQDENGLHFDVKWIRGVNHGIRSNRLFPDMLKYGEGNRVQTVNFGPDGTLWVTRNGDFNREFFILTPSDLPGGRWTLTSSLILPKLDLNPTVEAALLTDNAILTVESTFHEDIEKWYTCKYNAGGSQLISREETHDYMYGIACKDNNIVYITDRRSSMELGIYIGDKNIVPEIYGNGICLLEDGLTLVTRYGQASPDCFSEPGKLIYIPKHLLP